MSEANIVDLTRVDQAALENLGDKITQDELEVTRLIAQIAEHTSLYNAIGSHLNRKQQGGGDGFAWGMNQTVARIIQNALGATIEFRPAGTGSILSQNSNSQTEEFSNQISMGSAHESDVKTFPPSTLVQSQILPDDAFKEMKPARALFRLLRVCPAKPTLEEITTDLLKHGLPERQHFSRNIKQMVSYYVSTGIIKRDHQGRHQLSQKVIEAGLVGDEPISPTMTREITEAKIPVSTETIVQSNARDRFGRYITLNGKRTIDVCLDILKEKNVTKLHVKQFVQEIEARYGQKRTEDQIAAALRKHSSKNELVKAYGGNYFGELLQPKAKQVSI